MPRGLSLALSLCLAALVGCPQDPRDKKPPEHVATVGEAEILRTWFLAELARSGAPRVEKGPAREAVARQVLDQLIREELFFQAAKKEGISVDKRDVEREVRSTVEGYPPGVFLRVLHAEQLTLDQYRERVRRRLMIDRFLTKRLADLEPPSEAEVREAYVQRVAGRARPPQVRARQVLVKTEEEARYLLEEIRARRLTLEEAARRYSVAPEKDRGGDLGWFAKGDMPPIFEICFDLKPGEVSDVMASEYGFHIFEVIERREEHEEPFEEAKERLSRELRREREVKEVDRIVAELERTIPVEVNEEGFASAVALLPDPPKETGPGPDPGPSPDWSTYPRPRAGQFSGGQP